MSHRRTTSLNARRRAERRGHGAETIAGFYFRLKGYRILARRYRCPAGEIDLIARRGNHYAFIEVKARKNRTAGLESLSPAQRRRIVRAAGLWIAAEQARDRLPASYSASFDLLVVSGWRWPLHLKAAFDATM